MVLNQGLRRIIGANSEINVWRVEATMAGNHGLEV